MALAIERIDELQALVATIDAGSLSAAARTLCVPVNQVSRRLARLEERLGVVLVARTTRRLRLTTEGERFLPRARRVLGELEAAELELLRGETPQGKLRIAIPTLFTGGQVLQEMAETLHLQQAVSLELLVRDAPLDPIADGCDIAVVVGKPEAGRGRLVRLGEVAPALAATRGYLARAGVPADPSDLVDHECLRFVARGQTVQTSWTLVGSRGRRKSVAVGGRFASDSSRVLRDALFAGMGVGLIPELQLATAPGGLERVLPDHRFAPLELYAVCPPGPRHRPKPQLALALVRRAVELTVGAPSRI